MEQKIKPAFQTREYYPYEVIRCRDRHQQFVWLQHQIYPLDMYESNGDVIMIFPKNEKTKELYLKWRDRKL